MIDHTLIEFSFISGHMLKIKKTAQKIKPKLRFELIFILVFRIVVVFFNTINYWLLLFHKIILDNVLLIRSINRKE